LPAQISQELVNQFVNSAHHDIATLQKMLNESPELINMTSNQEETALQAAAHTGQKHIVEFLLQAGAPLDICAAALLGRKEDVRQFLEKDRSLINATGSHKIPLAFFSALGGDIALAELLLAYGLDLNAGQNVYTALHGAVMSNNSAMASWLLAHGARPDTKNFSGQTPMEMAVQFKRASMQEVFERAAQAS
jgi:ankyrin repeat protein